MAAVQDRLLPPWKMLTAGIAAFGTVQGIGGMVKFHSVDTGLSVFGNSIAPVSLVACSVALAALTWRFGYRGTAAFFMAAGFYDAGFDWLMGGVHTFAPTFFLDPTGLTFSTLLVPVGWWFAGRPAFRLGLTLVPLLLSYLVLYPPSIVPPLRFDMGVVPSMFFYVHMEMRRIERERGVQA